MLVKFTAQANVRGKHFWPGQTADLDPETAGAYIAAAQAVDVSAHRSPTFATPAQPEAASAEMPAPAPAKPKKGSRATKPAGEQR